MEQRCHFMYTLMFLRKQKYYFNSSLWKLQVEDELKALSHLLNTSLRLPKNRNKQAVYFKGLNL